MLLPAISHGTASHLPFRGAHRRSVDVAPRKGGPFAGGHYLLAGLLLGPFFLGRLGLSNFGIGFGTLEQVDSLSIITQVALTAAGEIIPEGRTNARTANRPEFPVSLD